MIQINPLKSYIDGGVRAAITTPPSASLVFDLPGKAIWVKGVKLKGTDHTYTFSHDNYITLTNTPDSNESEDIKIGVNTSALKNAIDTTYGVVSTTANGLAPKFTSGNKLAASAATTYYFLGWTGSTLKWYQAPFRNIRINSETTDRLGVNSTDPLIISSGNGISVTWDSTNKKIVITNTKPDVNHNTHYTTMLYIGENNDTKANKNVANPYLKLFDDNTRRATFQIKAGSGIAVASDANGNITITNSSPDVNHNTDRTGIKLTTVSGTKKTDSTLILANSTTGLNIQGGTNKFLIGNGTNYIEVPVVPSVSNKDATIGTTLTTLATIAGVDIKAKIASYSLSSHTHSVKINGSTKTITASGGTAVDLGSYLPLSGGTMILGEGLKFHADENYFGTNLDARIISLLDGNGTTCDGGLIIDERATYNGTEYVTELLRIRDAEFKWKGLNILHTGNSDVSGGGSTWGSSITVKINGTSKTLTIPGNPNTDYRVTQSETTTSNFRPLVVGYTNVSTAGSGMTGSVTEQVYLSNKFYIQPSTGNLYATTFVGTLLGNAATSSKWATVRILNLTGSVTGSASFDGSGNITLATTTNHTHSLYLPLAGGTMTGNIILKGETSTDMTYAGNAHPYIRFDNSDSSQNVSLIFTDYDAYRSPAGIKLVGNQGNEWFEAVNIYATTFHGTLSGNASSATALTTSAGSATLPIYFSGGKPVACTASSLFSNLSNSGNNLSITVAGLNRTLTVNYASNADSAYILNIKSINSETDIVQSGIRGYSGSGSSWTGSISSMKYAAIFSFGSPFRGWLLWAGRTGEIGNGLCWRRGILAATSWDSERLILDSVNYTEYTIKKDGTGASGTWNISITGNANTVDNIHATGFLRWKGMLNIGSNAPFQAVVDIMKDTSKLNDGGLAFYSYAGDEYTVLIGSRNDANRHGNALKWGYANKYLWMIRMTSGSPKSSDWEKISAGYADSAGNADTVDGQHFSYSNSSNSPTYLWATNSNGSSFLAARGSISVNYANSAGNSDTVDGYHASAFATSGHNHDSNYVSSLTTSGNSLRWVKNGSNNDITIPYATNAANITGGPIKTLADPGVSLLIKSYGLRSDYTSAGYPIEEYLKAWCKYAYANCSGKVAIGYVSPSSRGFIFADIYASGINNSSGLPEHITGRYYPHGGNGIKFGTSYGTWYYGNTNTWRGIQDNLTSTSTTDSLSANQGRLLANGSARDNTKLPLSGGILTGTLTMKTNGSGSYNQGIRINRVNTSSWALLLIGKSGDATSGTGTTTAGDGAWLIGTPASSNSLIFNLNDASESKGLCLKGHGANDMKWNNNTVYHAGNLPAYPTKASWNYDDRYVASVSISGNNLRINKNGINTDLIIPYATNADTVDGYHASSFSLTSHTHDYIPRRGMMNSAYACIPTYNGETGWHRIATIQGSTGFGSYILYLCGNWSYQSNTNAIIHIDTMHTTAQLTQVSGIVGYIDSIRLVNVSSNTYYVDVHINYTGANTPGTVYCYFLGNGTITPRTSAEKITESVTSSAELDLVNGGRAHSASSVVVNSSDANSTYRMVWHSGNTLYGTNNIYCNPYSDQIYSAGFRHVSYNSASYLLRSDGGVAAFNWSGQSGQPTWLWGGNSQHTYYVYNPSNFNVNSAAVLRGNASNPNNSHPGHGAKVFYSWNTGQAGNDTSGYSNGITIGSNPSDTAYGFQIVQNMWDDRTYTRRYNGGWQSWKTLAWTSDIPTVTNYYWANVKVSASSSTTTYPTFANIKSTGRVYLDELIQFSGSGGLYWPNTNNAHLYANTITSYGSLIIQGTRGGYCGLHCGPNKNYMTVMSTDTNHGLYCDNYGWEFYFNRSNGGVGIRTSSITKNFNVNGQSYLSSNVWIGTTSGGEMLNIGGWVNTIGNSGWYNSTYLGGWYMTDTSWVRTYNSKGIYTNIGTIYNLGHAYFACNSGYNVGIGTTSPSYKLHVNGTLGVTSSVKFTGLPEGTSTITDNTEILTSWASNNGFADSNDVGGVYRRDAIHLYNYIKGKTDGIYLPLSGGTLTGNLTMKGDKRITFNSSYIYLDSNGYLHICPSEGLIIENDTSFEDWNVSMGSLRVLTTVYASHFYENSDIRYKKILRNLSINSNTIATLPLFDFEWIENNTIGTGTSALAVQQILPNLVSGTDKLTLDYGVLGTIAGITACKELVTLKSELLQLKEKVKLLEDKLRKYENI